MRQATRHLYYCTGKGAYLRLSLCDCRELLPDARIDSFQDVRAGDHLERLEQRVIAYQAAGGKLRIPACDSRGALLPQTAFPNRNILAQVLPSKRK